MSTDSAGAFTTKVAVARRVSLSDCAVAVCVMRVSMYPADQFDLAISFDPSLPPPPVPAVAVNPRVGLVDRQVVGVEIPPAADAGSSAFMQLCRADGSACRGNVSKTVSDPVVVIPMALPRISPNVDCALVRCVVEVQLYGADSYEFKVPVDFDPNAPLAGEREHPRPARPGAVGSRACEVRGERLDPGDNVTVRQCISATGGNAGCGASQAMQVDSTGSLSGRFTVRRVLDLPDGTRDCVAVTCFLVVDGDPPTALLRARLRPAWTGEPVGPPPQLSCVSWPTHGLAQPVHFRRESQRRRSSRRRADGRPAQGRLGGRDPQRPSRL